MRQALTATYASLTWGEHPLEDVDRLEPLIGLLSVLAVWLLQLKFVARDDPQRAANTLFDDVAVTVMGQYLKRSPTTLTVGEFQNS